MLFATMIWPQPLAPAHTLALSALVAIVPLAVVLTLMGVFRKSGLLSSACGLATAAALSIFVWRMPGTLAFWSVVYGCIYAVWSIMWIVFAALWLYNLTVATGNFDLLRRWMQQHSSGDPCIQAILVAFCLGALLEGTAGFGAPVAITAFLLVGMGFKPRRAILCSLIADTAPVAFGALGIPIVALAGVRARLNEALRDGGPPASVSLRTPSSLHRVRHRWTQRSAANLAGHRRRRRELRPRAIFRFKLLGPVGARHYRGARLDCSDGTIPTNLEAIHFKRCEEYSCRGKIFVASECIGCVRPAHY